MCDIDLEPATVWRETDRTAAKEHRCSVCAGTIPVGGRVVVHFSICDGRPSSEKVCAPCHADRKEFAAGDGHGMCTPSYFTEMLTSCVYPDDAFVDDDAAAENVRWKAMLAGIRARGTSPLLEQP